MDWTLALEDVLPEGVDLTPEAVASEVARLVAAESAAASEESPA